MNKKLFGTLLLGSLLMGGTFVSCKDYDDDIENLQEQINNLATKSDVETKLGQLQSALTAAQQKAEEALAAAKAADNSAEVKALSEKLDKIADAQAAVNEALEATKNEISEQLAEFDEATKQMIADAQKKTEETIGKVADYVTEVDLRISNSPSTFGNRYQTYVTITEKENVFGKDLDGAITFVKGTQVQRSASTIVRVSPTNAELTPEMISLVDSKGRNLDDLLDVVKVERVENVLISRSTNSSLWKITTALKEYDKNKFEAAALTKVGDVYKHICYAVQINNSLSVAESRYVTSTYDIALYTADYKPVGNLSYFVGKKPIADIQNRATVTGGAPEYVWAAGPDVAIKKDLTNVKTGDNRRGKELYPLVQGEKVTITLDETSATDVKNASAPNIKALYVTLDEANAVESKPSELNAWNSYSYTGLKTVVEGNKIEISVNGETAVKDIIGFRVYAVNWDGTLVDPDGSAFYVKVGNTGDEFTGIPVSKTPLDADDKTGTSEKVTLAQQETADHITFATDKNDENITLSWSVKVGNTTYNNTTTAALVKAFQTKDGLKDAKVELRPDQALTAVKDGKAYTGKFEVYDADNFLLYTVPVSYTKIIPTTVPEGFTVKTNQVANGIYNCYLVPDAATGAKTGSMAMDQIFNFGKGNPAKYKISFAESAKNEKDELIAIDVVGTGSIKVAKDYIDDKTEHATSVSYNYGKISSEAKDKDGAIIDYEVPTDISFKTVYNCVYNSQFSWAYATRAELGGLYNTYNDPAHPEYGYKANPWNHELTYGTDDAVKVEDFIYGKTAIDSKFCGILTKLKASATSTYDNQLTYKDAKLITKANNQVNEYFSVTANTTGELVFTVEPNSSNPTGDVACTLEMTYTDAYGHDVKVSVDVTVKKR